MRCDETAVAVLIAVLVGQISGALLGLATWALLAFIDARRAKHR